MTWGGPCGAGSVGASAQLIAENSSAGRRALTIPWSTFWKAMPLISDESIAKHAILPSGLDKNENNNQKMFAVELTNHTKSYKRGPETKISHIGRLYMYVHNRCKLSTHREGQVWHGAGGSCLVCVRSSTSVSINH